MIAGSGVVLKLHSVLGLLAISVRHLHTKASANPRRQHGGNARVANVCAGRFLHHNLHILVKIQRSRSSHAKARTEFS